MNTMVAFLRRDYLIFASYRFSAVLTTLGIVMTVGMVYLVGQTVGSSPNDLVTRYGSDYMAYLMTAIAFLDVFWSAGFLLASSLRESQSTGTLEAMMLSPFGVYRIVLYSAAFPLVLRLVRLTGYVLIAVVFLGIWHNVNIVSALTVFIATLLAVGCTGLLSAAFLLVVKQGDPVIALYGLANGLLAGVFFPPQLLPEWVQTLSLLLPLTHGLEGMRLALLQGAGLDQVAPQLAALLALFLIQLPFTVLGLKWAVTRAKQEGSLVQY